MQTYNVTLKSDVSKTFRCQRAADSLDIDSEKKSVHEFSVSADLETPYTVGLIVGASGSGKTTLAHEMFGKNCFRELLINGMPIIEQLPEELSYDECASILSGVGLTAVPCWIRPAGTLSNGQKARAEAALQMTVNTGTTVIDEWTSVVDRTVAKVMSHSIQKFARRTGRRIVLVSCHYDVLEWLDPDWVIDCNAGTYSNRRLLPPIERQRKERLKFDVRETTPNTWKYFSKYHYLSETLPGGVRILFGLYHGENQIGFLCFSNYVPRRPGGKMILHFNRLVIHPDYVGLSIGIRFLNQCASEVVRRGYRVMGKFSSTPVYKSLTRDKHWHMNSAKRLIGNKHQSFFIKGDKREIRDSIRTNLRIYSFEYTGDVT